MLASCGEAESNRCNVVNQGGLVKLFSEVAIHGFHEQVGLRTTLDDGERDPPRELCGSHKHNELGVVSIHGRSWSTLHLLLRPPLSPSTLPLSLCNHLCALYISRRADRRNRHHAAVLRGAHLSPSSNARLHAQLV